MAHKHIKRVKKSVEVLFLVTAECDISEANALIRFSVTLKKTYLGIEGKIGDFDLAVALE